MKKITVANDKGGVGKTTVASSVAMELAKGGDRVMAVDLDPRGDFSDVLGTGMNDEGQGEGVSGFLSGVPLEKCWKGTLHERITVMPGNYAMTHAMQNIIDTKGEESLDVVKGLVEQLEESGNYDAVVFDCRPDVDPLCMGSFGVAPVLIPVGCEYLSLRGVNALFEAIADLSKIGRGVTILGIIPTMYSRNRSQDNQVLKELRRFCDDSKIELFPCVPRSTLFPQATSQGKYVGDMRGVEHKHIHPFKVISERLTNG